MNRRGGEFGTVNRREGLGRASKSVALWPRRGQLLAWSAGPPLSLEKTSSVFRHSCACFKDATSLPMLSSTAAWAQTHAHRTPQDKPHTGAFRFVFSGACASESRSTAFVPVTVPDAPRAQIQPNGSITHAILCSAVVGALPPPRFPLSDSLQFRIWLCSVFTRYLPRVLSVRGAIPRRHSG